MSRDQTAAADRFAAARGWFADQGFAPFAFQEEVWDAYARGESGLVHAPTGMGKTYAAAIGPLAMGAAGTPEVPPPLTALWITPLRALAGDTGLALARAATALQPHWTIDVRTGDTGAAAARTRQNRRLPTVLVTTPESLTLLLARSDWRERCAHLAAIVVDEWHELMGTKRGVQTELALARLSYGRPALRIWGLSATLGNLDAALACLVGPVRAERARIVRAGQQVHRDRQRAAGNDRTLSVGRPHRVKASAAGDSRDRGCAVDARVHQRPLANRDLVPGAHRRATRLGRDHRTASRLARTAGSRLGRGRAARRAVAGGCMHVEPRSRRGFRAGRPGAPDRQPQRRRPAPAACRAQRTSARRGFSRATVVPTQALELVEAAAARDAAASRAVEKRVPFDAPLDVLVQHLVTCALGGGFEPSALLAEVLCTRAYANISQSEWQFALDFVVHGGASLNAYPEYRRVVIGDDGIARVPDPRIARRHRIGIGTIVSESSITVRFKNGQALGHVEEDFIARLAPGDCFVFAGRALELLRVHELTAWVKPAKARSSLVPRWAGGRMALSTQLAEATRGLLADARRGVFAAPELKLVRPLLELQARWSALPGADEWLVEAIATREGHGLFFYPFEGRLAHLGLATLFSYRLSRVTPRTFSLTANDYGFGLLSPVPVPLSIGELGKLLAAADVEADVLAGLNAAELGRRQFREIARIAGLVFQGYPGEPHPARQLQASSALFYDVFAEYDPENLLLRQTVREVLERRLEAPRIATALTRLRGSRLLLTRPARPTPSPFRCWSNCSARNPRPRHSRHASRGWSRSSRRTRRTTDAGVHRLSSADHRARSLP